MRVVLSLLLLFSLVVFTAPAYAEPVRYGLPTPGVV